jgi:cyclic lactone autoinducer peptide
MKNKIVRFLGVSAMLVATMAVSSATWFLIEQPATPDALR